MKQSIFTTKDHTVSRCLRALGHSLLLLVATMQVQSMQAQESATAITPAQISEYTRTTQRSLAGIHDPSIVQNGKTFYIMGTHLGFARSADLINWSGLGMRFARVNSNGSVSSCAADQAFSVPQVKKVKALVNGTVKEVDFPAFNAEAWAHAYGGNYNVNGNFWAPDIIYNPTMKKWCMYMSVNGPTWNSSIVLLTSNTIEGEFVYQGPVTISGFLNGTDPAISWKKTDLELAIGTQNSLPARYNRGRDWGNHWPNDIDPCVFYDSDGQLWMSYGSWSGGIYMLKLDNETGLRDYTVTYPLSPASGDHASSDPYYGKHVAGGYYVSGEGSYIQKIGEYYYLFMSYGGLSAKEGYVMRLFRSKNPDGPYVDSQGTSAEFKGWQLNFGPGGNNRGFLLMSAYKDWGFQGTGQGRVAQGHNSAFVDDKGRAFVVYHTRYNGGNEWFQDRVQQLFVNDQGWLVAVPFEFNGETVTDEDIKSGCPFTDEEICGEYSLLLHRYNLDHENLECATPVTVQLNDGGKVTGDMTGTWKRTAGTSYIVLTLNNQAYRGVVTEQTIENRVAKAICISALCQATGQPVWAYKMKPEYAVAYAAKQYEVPIKNNASVSRNLPLYTERLYGATVEWTSSEPDIISNTGRYNAPDATTDVTLTCHISDGNCYYDQTFTVKAARNTIDDSTRVATLSPLAAFYDMDELSCANRYDESQHTTAVKGGTNGTKPTAESDPERDGLVAHTYAGSSASSSYLFMPNPLAGMEGLEGFTVSFWVKRADENLTAPLWSITDKRGNMSAVKQRLFFTGNAHLGFDNGTDSFDANQPAEGATTGTGYLPVGEWAFVSVSCDAEGIAIYVNGTKKTLKSFTSTAGEANTAAKSAALFPYQKVLDMVTAAEYMQLGIGVKGEGSPEAWYDDVIVHARALSIAEARTLNLLANRVTDFGQGTGTGIWQIEDDRWKVADWGAGAFDLNGRRIANKLPHKGIYIVNGRKVVVK